MTEQDIKFFTQIPAWVDEIENISDFQARLLGYIYTFENITGTAFPSNGKIAERFHKKAHSVQNALSDLYQKGYLKSEVTYKENSKEVERRFLYVIEPRSFKKDYPVIKKGLPQSFKKDNPSPLKVTDNILINKSINKSINNIHTTELDINSNIDTKTSAYKKVVGMFENNGFGSVGGIIATNINDELDDFVQDDNYEQASEVLCKAIEIAVNQGKNKPAYVWGITKNWYQKKLFTVEAIEAELKKNSFSGGYRQPEKKKLKNGGYGTR